MEKVIKEIEVFKSGTHTDSEGDTREWTKEDLELIVKTYNERLASDEGSEAPVVKGHPETDDPAFGWVKELKLFEDKVIAVTELNKDFVEEVKDELYKKVSIALYPDLMLRHLGFLGAAQPAVKGLEPVKFNSKEFKTLNFEEPVTPTTNTLEDFKKSQLERSKQYGIGVKDGIGYIEKPQCYADLTDDQFADPVNYLYPIHDKPNWLASWKLWDNWDNREQYKNIERQIILARFLSLAESYGIEFEKKIYFNEFSISLKDNLKRDKPTVWNEYSTEDFGDPVHFRFPLKSLSDVKASIAIFSRDNVFSQYEEKEQQYIASRIIRAAKSNGINLTPNTWAYVDIPAEKLTKNQLLDIVKNNNDKNKFSNNEVKMEDYLKNLSSFLVQKLSEASSEELATQLQGWIDEFKTSNPIPSETPTEPEPTPQEKQYSERIEKLEKENRQMKFNQYYDGLLQSGKVVPAQKDLVLTLLEATHNNSELEFAENNQKTKSGIQDTFKKLIESFPSQIEFGDSGRGSKTIDQDKSMKTPEGFQVDDERLDLHNKVIAYMEEQKGKGVQLNYSVALQHVGNKGRN